MLLFTVAFISFTLTRATPLTPTKSARLHLSITPQDAEALIASCKTGNLAHVQRLIKQYGKTAIFSAVHENLKCLGRAAQNARWDLVEYLAEQGIDVNQRDFAGITPIFYTPTELTAKLIKMGANVNEMVNELDRLSVLYQVACYQIYPGKLDLLIKAGAVVDAKGYKGNTALRGAISTCAVVPAEYAGPILQNITTLIKYGASLKKASEGKDSQMEFEKGMKMKEVKEAIERGRRLADEMIKST